MRTRNIVLSVLAGLSIVSCTQNVADKPMQIESVNALFDSIAKRDIYGRRILRCLEDSVLYEEYNICHVLTDTTGKNNTINYDKEWMRKQTEDHNYLLRNVPDMLDMLCRTAEKSYRYISGDSIDYNITLGNNPQELLYLRSYSEVNRNKVFDFCYMVEKPANITVKSGDVTSVRELLQAFLAEQKKVKKYEVKYEWDKDVAIPDNYNTFLPTSYQGHGSDSLAVVRRHREPTFLFLPRISIRIVRGSRFLQPFEPHGHRTASKRFYTHHVCKIQIIYGERGKACGLAALHSL